MHQDEQAAVAKVTTFTPSINQKSRKLAERAKEEKKTTFSKK